MAKLIDVFPPQDASSKIVYLVTRKMNERYSKRVVPEFWLVKEAILSIRREKYGQVEVTVPELCPSGCTQNS